jgi:N-methylhydantoinase A
VLGRIDGENFSGGKIRLDASRARDAVHDALGALGVADEELALGIAEMVEENMAGAARVHAIESGKQLTDRTLIAFGGAAPLHAARLAEKLDMNRVVIPNHAGVGSAVGFLRAPVAYEITRSLYQRLDALDLATVNACLAEMGGEAKAIVREGASNARRSESRTVFIRYAGQGHEIAVALPDRVLHSDDVGMLRESFEASYRGLYRRTVPGAAIEALSWTVRVSAAVPNVSRPSAAPSSVAPPQAAGERLVFDHRMRGFIPYRVYRRSEMVPGHRISGPVVIVEDETATLVTGSFDGVIAPDGAIVLERRAAAAGESP